MRAYIYSAAGASYKMNQESSFQAARVVGTSRLTSLSMCIYLKFGFEEAEDSSGNDPSDAASIDAENSDEVSIRRRLQWHRRSGLLHTGNQLYDELTMKYN